MRRFLGLLPLLVVLLSSCFALFPSSTVPQSPFAKDPAYIKLSGTINPFLTKDKVMTRARDYMNYNMALRDVTSTEAVIADAGYRTAHNRFDFPAARVWLVTITGKAYWYGVTSTLIPEFRAVKVALSTETGEVRGHYSEGGDLVANVTPYVWPSLPPFQRYLYRPTSSPATPGTEWLYSAPYYPPQPAR